MGTLTIHVHLFCHHGSLNTRRVLTMATEKLEISRLTINWKRATLSSPSTVPRVLGSADLMILTRYILVLEMAGNGVTLPDCL